MTATFYVLKDGEVKYEAKSLPQAQGYVDASLSAGRIVADVVTTIRGDWLYRVLVVDRKTGQIVCKGPLIDIGSAADLMDSLAIVVLPADIESPEYLLKEKYLSDLDICEGCERIECECDEERWKEGGTNEDDDLEGAV